VTGVYFIKSKAATEKKENKSGSGLPAKKIPEKDVPETREIFIDKNLEIDFNSCHSKSFIFYFSKFFPK
jgi:hypothetical protein